MPEFIMAEPDENYFVDDWDLFNEAIDVPDDEYDATIEKMRNVNKDIMIWDFDQVLDFDLGNEYGTIFDMLFVAIAIIMTVTIFSMTFLYQQIFIEEETSDIAMLKSIGVDRSSIRGWHYLRILILVLCAIVLGFLLSFTVSKALFNQVGMAVLGVGKFALASPTPFSMIVIPLGLLVLVSISLLLAFKPIDSIKIWRVRDE
jgi:ABC-type antimicrobial peptide transport system permease subunit